MAYNADFLLGTRRKDLQPQCSSPAGRTHDSRTPSDFDFIPRHDTKLPMTWSLLTRVILASMQLLEKPIILAMISKDRGRLR